MEEGQEINPYTKALDNCLKGLEGIHENKVDEQSCHFLANMIQGRFLQYLASRICDLYQVNDSELKKKLMMSVLNIMSQQFFVVFREKVKVAPRIVFQIARKIKFCEMSPHHFKKARIDQLYLGICKKYFAYNSLELIFTWIESNSEVQKIILVSKFKKLIDNPANVQVFSLIVQEDHEGVTPKIFNRYMDKGKKDRLINLIQTGDWRLEADYLMKVMKDSNIDESSRIQAV